MGEKEKKIYFDNLDVLRFFAASIVFLSHTMKVPLGNLGVKQEWINKLFSIVTDGGIGVSIFFVLSGFLITYLILLEIESKGKIDIKKFYVRRFLRSWP